MRCAVAVVALLAFPLLARAVEKQAAASLTCGDNVVQPGEQCDGTSDSACPGMCNDDCRCPPVTTFDLESRAHPANTPGSPHVSVTNAKLLAQFGKRFSLNKATYTRFRLGDSRESDGALEGREKPDAILILIPGFEGGAGNFRILAQNLLKRARTDHNLVLEVWAFDRRTHQLEDTAGLDIAEGALDPALARELAVRDRAWPSARPTAGTPRRFLQRAGRRPVPRKLDESRLFAGHRRRREGGAQTCAPRERVPWRALGGHRLRRPLRGDRLQHHTDLHGEAEARVREPPRPRAARRRWADPPAGPRALQMSRSTE